MRILRRDLFFLPAVVVGVAACGPGKPALSEPPRQIHGGWTRETLTEQGPGDVPESIKGLNPVKVWRVTYRGPQDISGLWILYPHETVAFEAIQRISKSTSIRPFFRGSYFIMLDTAGVPQQALGDFREGVIKALP